MASFVEQATLRLIDQTSSPAAKINRELGKLFSTANRLQRLKGPAQLTRDLNAAARAAQRIPAITVRVNSGQVALAITRLMQLQRMAGQPLAAQRLAAGGFGGGGGRGNIFSSRGSDGNAQAAGRIMARAFTAAIGFEIYGAVRRVAGSAVKGILDEDSAIGALRMTGLSPAEIMQRRGLANDVSAQFPELSRAMVLNSTRELGNLALTAGDARTQMMNFGKAAVNLGVALGDMDRGAESARQLFRMGGLLGTAQDPMKMAAVVDEATRAIIASGGDVQGAEIRRTVQQLRGQGLDLSPQAIGDLTSLRDEGGMMSTAEVRMFMNDLTRSNLNRGDLARQIKAGLRDAQGNTIGREELLANPFQHVFDNVLPEVERRLKKFGGSLDNAADVQKVLSGKGGMGFTTSGAAFAQRAISQRSQIMADRAARARVDVNAALNPANKTLRQEFAAIESQFNNAAAEITRGMTPTLKSAMQGMTAQLKTIADPNADAGDKVKAAAKAATAAIPLAVPAMLANLPQMLQNPATAPLATAGLTLTAAGGQLIAAAGALGALAGVAALLPEESGDKNVQRMNELRNNPLGTSGQRDAALKQVIAEQKARGEALDMVKAQAEAQRRVAAAVAQELAARERIRDVAKAQAENDNKPKTPLDEANRKLDEANQVATRRAEAKAQLKRNEQAQKDLEARQKEIDRIADPIRRQAMQKQLDEDTKKLPEARKKMLEELAASDRELLKAYEGLALGGERKNDPQHIKDLRELRRRLDKAEGRGTYTPGEGGPRRPTEFGPSRDDEGGKGRGEEGNVPGSFGGTPLPDVVNQLGATFTTGAGELAAGGTQAGANFNAAINPAGLGDAIGAAAGAQIRAAVSNVQVTAVVVNQPKVGTNVPS